jgi:hypothetical protein
MENDDFIDYEKAVTLSKQIVDDYKHNVGDIYLQLVSASQQLNMPITEMFNRWEKASINDFDKVAGIFFILTGKTLPKN